MNDALPIDILTFKLNDDGKLPAAFKPCECMSSLDIATVKEALAKQCLSDLFFYENALSNLVKQYNTPNEGFVLEIGERRDGECIITIDVVKMSARLTLTPPYGGTPVALSQIELALQDKGVVSDIIMTEIEDAVKDGYATERIVAKGLAPVRGTDARFQSLIPQIRERKPRVDQRGVADYRDLGQLIVVKPGDPLMCRTPPTEGKRGRDITGQVLMPQPGQDTQ